MTDFIKFSYQLTGAEALPIKGEAESIEALRDPIATWLHLQADHPEVAKWARQHLAFVDPNAIAALLAAETRPRATAIDEGVLVILRGVNMNAGQRPEDMVSIRLWVDPTRVVSMSLRPLRAVDDLTGQIESGRGPTDTGGFLCALLERLAVRIENFLRELDDQCDGLEEELLETPEALSNGRITGTRQKVVVMRRYIGPQRDAIAQLYDLPLPFISKLHRRRLREVHDRMLRAVEELDAMRERLQVVADELNNTMAVRLNRNLYVLSFVSVVFLPLGFLTGLMGINLAGIPGSEAPAAFWVFTVILCAVAFGTLLTLRKLRWI